MTPEKIAEYRQLSDAVRKIGLPDDVSRFYYGYPEIHDLLIFVQRWMPETLAALEEAEKEIKRLRKALVKVAICDASEHRIAVSAANEALKGGDDDV